MYKKDKNVVVDSAEDSILLGMFENIMSRYNKMFRLSTGHYFNQSVLVNSIISYLNSRYVNSNKNNTQHFFNIMRKIRDDFVRKTHVKFSKLLLTISDKSLNFLLNAAKVEFEDDHDIEGYALDRTKSFANFGTCVSKIVRKGKKKNTVKVIPFNEFLCDPQHADKNVSGEVTQTTLFDLQSIGKYRQDSIKAIINTVIGDGKNGYDPQKVIVRVYEMHGKLPNNVFEKGKSGFTQGMFVVAELEGGSRYILYAGRTEVHPYIIEVLDKVEGRTMGFGPMEGIIEFQIMHNKVGNLAIDQLESTKIFYQTSDSENDGFDLSELDNNTLLYHSPDAQITQVSSSPQGFGAMSSFLSSVTTMSYEAASIPEASLGRSVNSNTSFAANAANLDESNGTYTFIRDIYVNMYRKIFKRKNGFLRMIIDYIETGKDIEELLSPSEARGFKKHVAEKIANIELIKQIEDESIDYEDDYDELVDFILRRDKDYKYHIEIKDGDIDVDYIIDKSRITYGDQSSALKKEIEVVGMALDKVISRPELFTTYNPDELLRELMELTSLSVAYNNESKKVPVQPETGPQVAVNRQSNSL